MKYASGASWNRRQREAVRPILAVLAQLARFWLCPPLVCIDTDLIISALTLSSEVLKQPADVGIFQLRRSAALPHRLRPSMVLQQPQVPEPRLDDGVRRLAG